MINSITLVGRLTADVDARQAGSTTVGTFTLAVNRTFSKDKKADFIRIKTFGKTAENCAKFLKKGNLAGIQGRLQIDSYENDEGRRVYITEVVADIVSFLEPKDKRGDDSKYPELSGYTKVEDEEDDLDDIIPF